VGVSTEPFYQKTISGRAAAAGGGAVILLLGKKRDKKIDGYISSDTYFVYIYLVKLFM
jgi:hypothetical protein